MGDPAHMVQIGGALCSPGEGQRRVAVPTSNFISLGNAAMVTALLKDVCGSAGPNRGGAFFEIATDPRSSLSQPCRRFARSTTA